MDKSTSDRDLLEDTIKIARDAGSEILRVYDSDDFNTSYKEDNSPLTAADEAANQLILARLAELAPEIPVISEEGREIAFDTRCQWNTCWLVDPLDGTKEFIKRNGEFTVNIGLMREGKVVLGVVYAPVLKTIYAGVVGSGAFKIEGDGMPREIKAGNYQTEPLVVVGSRSHASETLKALFDLMQPAETIAMGSSLKICLVAEGKAHFYPRLGPTMEWDTAAAEAVLEAAGGRMTDVHGKEMVYNKEDLRNPFFIACGNPPYPWKDLEPLRDV